MLDPQSALLEMFRSHGVAAEVRDDWIVFPGRPQRAQAEIVLDSQQGELWRVQLDVRLVPAPGRMIVESFADLGGNRDEAVANALRNFALNSLHVLLAAIFDAADEQSTSEEWMVDGRKARAMIGPLGMRGQPPEPPDALLACVQAFDDALRRQKLRPGTHWARLFFAQAKGEALACEALLDNVEHAGLDAAMAGVDWPAADEFYSARHFVVLCVEPGGEVTPALAVDWFAEALAERPDSDEDEWTAALAEAGVPAALARRACLFTQVAWGRALIDGMGMRFSPDYVGFDAAGRVAESGRLAEDPCFAEAVRIAEGYAASPGFMRLAAESADVKMAYQAHQDGADPKNLTTGTLFLFLEPPTEAGLKAATRVIGEYAGAAPSGRDGGTSAGARPWWQSWS